MINTEIVADVSRGRGEFQKLFYLRMQVENDLPRGTGDYVETMYIPLLGI